MFLPHKLAFYTHICYRKKAPSFY